MRAFVRGSLALVCIGFQFHIATAADLREREAVEIFRRHNPSYRALMAEMDAVRAEADISRLYPNPEAEWTRERVSGRRPTSTEHTATVEIPVNVGGRYRFARRAADLNYEEQKKSIEREMFELENDARIAFYTQLFAQDRVSAVREGVGRIRSLLAAIQAKGSSELYDQVRIGMELADAEGMVEEAEIRLVETAANLRRHLGQTAGDTAIARLAGELAPQESLPDFQNMAARAADRDDLTALKWRTLKHEVLLKSARTAWLPDLKLTVGRKGVDETNQDGSGLVAGVSMEIPIFSRARAAAAAEEARRKVAEAEYAALSNEIRAFLGAQHTVAARRAALARRYARTAFRQAEKLEQAAGASYLEGRRSLLEMLDAYRSSLAVRLKTLDLAFEARLAALLLERFTGSNLEEIK